MSKCSVYFVALLLVFLLAGEFVKATPQASTVTPTFTRKTKDAVKTASEAAKSVWKASTKTVSGFFKDKEKNCDSNNDDPLSSPLGPDKPSSCTKKQEEDSSPPEEDNVPSHEDLEGSDFELATIDEESESVLSQIMGFASTGVSTVYRTAKENVFDRGAKLIHNFSESVRHIVHEELYLFLQTVTNSLGASLLTPGATLYYLGQTAMTVVIFLLCVLFSYIFLFRVSIIVLLGANASVFLVHHFMGPKWIFDCMFFGASYFTWILTLMYNWPKTSAVVLVLLFVYFAIFPLIKYCTERGPKQRMVDLENVVLDISQRLGTMEEKQEEILDILRRLDNKPNE